MKARAAALDAFDRVQERRSALGLSGKCARDGKMARAGGAAGGRARTPRTPVMVEAQTHGGAPGGSVEASVGKVEGSAYERP